jgi:hypothetical protein
MMAWTEALSLINLFVAIGVLVGGYIAIKSSMAKTSTEIQDRVRDALHDENEILQFRLKRIEADNKRLNNLMALIMSALKKTHGIELEIGENLITMRDTKTGNVNYLQEEV